MTSNDKIIEKAKSKIGDLNQLEIREKDSIDVRVGFDEGGPIKFYTVRFYKDKIEDKIVWDYADIVERS